MKFYNPCRTTDGEGTALEHVRPSGMKAKGASRIRYPGSLSCKRCGLSVKEAHASFVP